jgi:Ser/Thr protein kinase RdoA (MazF antagonist)
MFPVTDSNLRADALVAQVLSQYPLGAINDCRLHQRGLNDTYKVATVGNATYFLRIYRAGWRQREEIETEIAILLHLAREKVNVSTPVARTDGQFLTPVACAEGKRWAAVFTAAPGKEVDYKAYTPELAANYGAAAAAIHDAADSFAGHRLRPAVGLTELLEQPLRTVIATIPHRPDDVSHIDHLGDRLRRRIEQWDDLEVGFCHGDFRESRGLGRPTRRAHPLPAPPTAWAWEEMQCAI